MEHPGEVGVCQGRCGSAKGGVGLPREVGVCQVRWGSASISGYDTVEHLMRFWGDIFELSFI